MNKVLRFLLAFSCLLGFLYIRFRESELFYDPLIHYFHGDYQNAPLPSLATAKLFLHLLFRYMLHLFLSLGLLWALFMDKQILTFATLFYIVLFIVLAITLYVLLQNYDPKSYLPLFYVRRFLIQPLLIFLLVPAFFYARKVTN